jgi:hypothetical protein
MKKYLCGVLAVFASCSLLFAGPDTDWDLERSTHFVVYYKNAQQKFVDELVEKAEGYYDKIADDLGFRRYNFWLWDNRAKIYIHDSAAGYHEATGQPEWSSGCAFAAKKEIYTYPYAKKFFETVLPHEMGHIIFREFVGFGNKEVPMWLDEGVASYEEVTRSSTGQFIKSSRHDGRFIPVVQLSQYDLHGTSDQKMIRLFYAESVNIVDYLIKKFGKETFIAFCQDLRDKRSFTQALSKNYPFSDIGELGAAWEKQL